MNSFTSRLNVWSGICLAVLLALLTQADRVCADPPAYDGTAGITSGQKCVNPKDNAVMVWVPAGAFLMGSTDADAKADSDEKPQHTVTLDGFWIYQNDVTVAQYKAYCAATGEDMPKDAPEDTHPMVNVNWKQSRAYAKWAGARLPSEAQWEKAARGADGRIYPWGNTWDADKCNNQATGPDKTTPVGNYPEGASPYGSLDMAGNVWQWCEDWYGNDYYKNSPATNPKGPDEGERRVRRGGCWDIDTAARFRCVYRDSSVPGDAGDLLGFRCVVSPPGQ